MADDALPERAAKKATNVTRDANLAILVGMIPILGLIYILRLVQWYLLRKQYQVLAESDSQIAVDFRSGLHKLWFAVLFWPVLILFIIVYFQFT